MVYAKNPVIEDASITRAINLSNNQLENRMVESHIIESRPPTVTVNIFE
jgi:hypothetical protein